MLSPIAFFQEVAPSEVVVREPVTLSGWLDNLGNSLLLWVQNSAPYWLQQALLFVVIVALSRIVGIWVSKMVNGALSKTQPKTTQLLRTFAVSITRKAFFVLGIVWGLDSIGFAVGPFLAGFGVAGIVIGFALKDTLANFAAGVMIIFYHPFEIGDSVIAGKCQGTVSNMNLSHTTLLSGDNQRIIVPNSKIWGAEITNITANPRRRIEISTAIARGQDLATVERVLRKVADDHPNVLQDPEPAVKLNDLTDGAAHYILRAWCATKDYGGVRWDLLRAIQLAFEAEQIHPPVQRREVHMHQVNA